MGSDYWAALVGGEKIKTDGLKQQTRTNVITQTALNDKLKLMSLPINGLSYLNLSK